MPKATVSDNVVHKDLESCPEGFVDLRRLPFGGMLKRRDMASKMSMAAGQEENSEELRFEFMQEVTRAFEFKHCIVDHNLEDIDGRKLDFNNPADIFKLDPRIGQEIETYIDELNQELTEEQEADFQNTSGNSSKVEVTTPPE